MVGTSRIVTSFSVNGRERYIHDSASSKLYTATGTIPEIGLEDLWTILTACKRGENGTVLSSVRQYLLTYDESEDPLPDVQDTLASNGAFEFETMPYDVHARVNRRLQGNPPVSAKKDTCETGKRRPPSLLPDPKEPA